MSTIPLAKGFSAKHLRFPVFLSHKIDGVPVRIDIDEDGKHTIRTRQGKDVPSIRNLVQEFADKFRVAVGEGHVPAPCTLVGEVHQHGDVYADFKTTSGIVRRQEDQSHTLSIALFEISTPELEYHGFQARYEAMQAVGELHSRVYAVYQHPVYDIEELEAHFEQVCITFPKAEGMVARNWNDPFSPGKRSWGYQKLLREPTIDLLIVDFEEAIDKHGNLKGMVGRLVAMYKGTKIGIGPGRLTHDERIALWKMKQDHIENHGESDVYLHGTGIAQIKYKKDDSYDALRQPTFQFWRDDKSVPDA